MTETMLISVRVPKDIAKRLPKLAEATDRSKSDVAGQAIEECLALHEWQVWEPLKINFLEVPISPN